MGQGGEWVRRGRATEETLRSTPVGQDSAPDGHGQDRNPDLPGGGAALPGRHLDPSLRLPKSFPTASLDGGFGWFKPELRSREVCRSSGPRDQVQLPEDGAGGATPRYEPPRKDCP